MERTPQVSPTRPRFPPPDRFVYGRVSPKKPPFTSIDASPETSFPGFLSRVWWFGLDRVP